MDNPLYYLQEGPQTAITSKIRQTAKQIPHTNGKDLAVIIALFKESRKLCKGSDYIEQYLNFTMLARAKGIPIMWIEANSKERGSANSRYFLDNYVNKEFNSPGYWVTVYPEQGVYHLQHEYSNRINFYLHNYQRYFCVAKGLDPASMRPVVNQW